MGVILDIYRQGFLIKFDKESLTNKTVGRRNKKHEDYPQELNNKSSTLILLINILSVYITPTLKSIIIIAMNL